MTKSLIEEELMKKGIYTLEIRDILQKTKEELKTKIYGLEKEIKELEQK